MPSTLSRHLFGAAEKAAGAASSDQR